MHQHLHTRSHRQITNSLDLILIVLGPNQVLKISEAQRLNPLGPFTLTKYRPL